MGIARRLMLLAGIVVPTLAAAVCEPGAEGLVVTEAAGTLQVAAVAPNSPAALGGIVPGDALLQVNGERPRTCAEWRGLVDGVRRSDIQLLVLVRHGLRQRVIAVRAAAPATEELAPAPDPGVVLAAPPAVKRVPRPTTTVPADLLPDAVPVTRVDVVSLLAELGEEGRARYEPYRQRVTEVRRALSTLLIRDPGTADADALLRLVRLHEGAVIAWEAVEDIRTRQGLRPSMPVSVGATESYFAGSRVAALIDEIPLLTKAVRQAPTRTRVEIAGRWEPMRARQLLWAEADAGWSALVGGEPRD